MKQLIPNQKILNPETLERMERWLSRFNNPKKQIELVKKPESLKTYLAVKSHLIRGKIVLLEDWRRKSK